MKHKVKTHRWVNGHLQTRNYIFDSAEQAEHFISNGNHYMAKMYNEHGMLVKTYDHSDGRKPPVITEFYA